MAKKSDKDKEQEIKEKEVIDVDGYELEVAEPVEVELPAEETKKRIPFKLLSPLQKIQMVAAQQGIETLSAAPSCKKCYGRGYISETVIPVPQELSASREAEMDEDGQVHLPNPCKCIFKKEDRPKMFRGTINLNRKLQRKYEKRQSDELSKTKVNAVTFTEEKLAEIKKKKKRLKKLKSKQKKLQRKR